MIQVTAPGADELAADLAAAADQLADLPTDEAAQLIRPLATDAPRATGALAASITVTATADTISVDVAARYAMPVHQGTTVMPGRPWLSDAADPDRVAALYQKHLDDTAATLEGTY